MRLPGLFERQSDLPLKQRSLQGQGVHVPPVPLQDSLQGYAALIAIASQTCSRSNLIRRRPDTPREQHPPAHGQDQGVPDLWLRHIFTAQLELAPQRLPSP